MNVQIPGKFMIIGRKKEREWLERAFLTNKNRFITIYGRRRVGKTYLITQFFKDKDCIFFHVAGLQQGRRKEQIANFTRVVAKLFLKGEAITPPGTWKEAFELLSRQIDGTNKKVVLFFDELQWMATPKSGLLTTIDYFWNKEWYSLNNLEFVACGSSVSWILKNIIYNTGGLHNRTNVEINLKPFTLAETKEYLKHIKIQLNDDHVLTLYMALGGIPYYLEYLSPGKTAQENIQQLFFDANAPLGDEYNKLFESLFDGSKAYKDLIEYISQTRKGTSLAQLTSLPEHSGSGGTLTDRLEKLCDAGFIEKYIPWKKERGIYYKVIDEFCLFYLYWIRGAKTTRFAPDHWLLESNSQRYTTWAGYAFEAVCSKHILQIIRSLNIKTASSITSWRYTPKSNKERGAQIDLIILRADDAITLVEIKYTRKPFVLDKTYAAILNNKIEMFRKQTKTDKQLFLAFVSAHGLKQTLYSEEMVSEVVTSKDLFKEYGY